MLQTIVPELSEDMSRRNTVRVNLRGNTSAPPSGSDLTDPQEKRQKTTHDFFPTKTSTPRPVEKEKPEASVAAGSGMVLKAVDIEKSLAPPKFAPSFAIAKGRVVSTADSVKADHNIVVAMLQRLALLKDMERIPKDLQPSLVHASAYLVQVRIFVFQPFPLTRALEPSSF